MNLTELQTKLLPIVQTRFPLKPRPFAALAHELDATELEVLAAIRDLTDSGAIRSIAPIFDAARLGYTSTLVAATVPDPELADFVDLVNAHPGVSHNYARTSHYNLWFTLAARNQTALLAFLNDLSDRHPGARICDLPSHRRYKLRAAFDPAAAAPVTDPGPSPAQLGPRERVILGHRQIELIRRLQEPLAIAAEPYDAPARQAGWSPDELLAQARTWLDQGVIRRYGARVRQDELGFTANAMLVLEMPELLIDAAGKRLALSRNVSHCYHRPPLADWPFNVYAMLHCRNNDELARVTDDLLAALEPTRHDLLRTTKEYKKEPVKYFMEDPS